ICLGRKNERCAAAPAPHQLRRNPLLALCGRPAVLAQKVAKCAHVLLQSSIGHVAAISRENLWFRRLWRRTFFTGISEDEFAGLNRWPGAGRRHNPGPFNLWGRKSVAVTEVLPHFISRLYRL